MVWVKIDDHFDEHPKWADAPGDSIALWLAAVAWCNRNDSVEGFIPAFKLHGRVKVRNLKRTTNDLVERGAFHPVRDGYLIHDYVEYQQPEKVKAIHEKRSAAGRKGAAARWGERARAAEYADAPPHDDTQAIANGMPNAMTEAIAKKCPVPRSPSSSLHGETTSPSRVPVDAIEDESLLPSRPDIGAWAESLRMR